MATVSIHPAAGTTIIRSPGQIVKCKRFWADSWTVIPFLWCNWADDTGEGSASFEWRFGSIAQPGFQSFATWDWLTIAGCYIEVDGYDEFGYGQIWIGVVEDEVVSPFAGSVPSGVQEFTACGLSSVLGRRQVLGAYVLTAAGVTQQISGSIRFNNVVGKRVMEKNASASPNALGVYSFSEFPNDGQYWTNRGIVDYLLCYYVNGNAMSAAPAFGDAAGAFNATGENWYGADGFLGPHFYLSGNTAILDSMYVTCQFDGQSVFRALGELIPVKRGLGWHIVTDGVGDCFIEVYSELEPINAVSIDTSTLLVQPTINFQPTHSYDFIHVQGGTVSVCWTWATSGLGALPPLIADWDAGIASEYAAISFDDADKNDQARKADKYKHVFSRFKIPSTWGAAGMPNMDGTVFACPVTYPDGTLDFGEGGAPQSVPRFKFAREIPFYETDIEGQTVSRRPFVLVQTEGEEEEAGSWRYVDCLPDGNHGASVRPDDDTPAVNVTPNGLPHVASKGIFDPDEDATRIVPEYAYTSYLFTAMVETSSRIWCAIPLSNQYAANDVPRIRMIQRDDLHFDIVAPNTVTDINPSDPTTFLTSGGSPVITRDDTGILVGMARIAAMHYLQQQAIGTVQFQTIHLLYPVGTAIAGLSDAAGFSPVGTIVHGRKWDFQQDTTTISTGFSDFDDTDIEELQLVAEQHKIQHGANHGGM